MTLSEELTLRGFTNQTTYKDITALDGEPISFYLGVDPSADSMTIGNLAIVMMVRHFINHGHNAFMLVGGATGLIGDPDGKSQERELQSLETIAHNKQAIAAQYTTLLGANSFTMVDNYDWFKNMHYLDFLRDVGKHVPMRSMLGRDFVSSRLGEDGAGISYAEFSYSLIQGYDFLHLHREHGVSLQVCGADQWGNSIAGVDLIRRVTGAAAHIWSAPLIVNKTTGVKFGKSEAGAVWLDPAKTSPTQFYQFWINCDDAGVADYLKIYTLLTKEEIDGIVSEQQANPAARVAQKRLAAAVTSLVHGPANAELAAAVTDYLTGATPLDTISDSQLEALKNEIPYIPQTVQTPILESLVASGLASSVSEGRRLLTGNAISVNGQKVTETSYAEAGFQTGRVLLRRGKAFKDSAIVELR
ncbi:MAG: tyrosine--tRNA ligase [Patescibacteria group bacterium]|nr:tyrosine--tRNA ligase [Patescibacteria group bacterium]